MEEDLLMNEFDNEVAISPPKTVFKESYSNKELPPDVPPPAYNSAAFRSSNKPPINQEIQNSLESLKVDDNGASILLSNNIFEKQSTPCIINNDGAPETLKMDDDVPILAFPSIHPDNVETNSLKVNPPSVTIGNAGLTSKDYSLSLPGLKVGAQVLYNSIHPAVVVACHNEGDEIYYTISWKDKERDRETQTTKDRLKLIDIQPEKMKPTVPETSIPTLNKVTPTKTNPPPPPSLKNHVNIPPPRPSPIPINKPAVTPSSAIKQPPNTQLNSKPSSSNQKLSSSISTGGGPGKPTRRTDNGQGDEEDDSSLPSLPTAPSSKLLTKQERVEFEAENKKREEIEKRNQARKESFERSKATELKLGELRRQYENENIEKSRIEDYLLKRKRHSIIAKECARRMTYSPNTHESRLPKPEDEEVAEQLKSLPFNDGWQSVFHAFGVWNGETIIKCSQSDEIVNHIWRQQQKVLDPNFVTEYLKLVLEGIAPTPTILRMIRAPPEQYDPDVQLRIPSHSIGKAMKAAPVIFTSILSEQMDCYTERRRGEPLRDEDWRRLLNTAKNLVDSLYRLTFRVVCERYPSIQQAEYLPQLRSGGLSEKRCILLVRESIQQSLVNLFHVGLPLFYYQVFGGADRLFNNRTQAYRGMSLFDLARKFGLNSMSKSRVYLEDQELEILEQFGQAITPDVAICPFTRLDLLVKASRFLAGGDIGGGGDDFLPMFIASICLSSQKFVQIKVASLANIIDDFALHEELKSGEGGFIISLLLTTIEAVLSDKT